MIGLIGKTSSPPVASLSRASAPPALSSDSQPRRAGHAIGNRCRPCPGLARRSQLPANRPARSENCLILVRCVLFNDFLRFPRGDLDGSGQRPGHPRSRPPAAAACGSLTCSWRPDGRRSIHRIGPIVRPPVAGQCRRRIARRGGPGGGVHSSDPGCAEAAAVCAEGLCPRAAECLHRDLAPAPSRRRRPVRAGAGSRCAPHRTARRHRARMADRHGRVSPTGRHRR